METPENESPRSTIVIAGGSGFIGRRLSAVLAGAGYDIVVLSRAAPRPPVGPVRFVQWTGVQATDRDEWPAVLEGTRAVVNLCGESIGGPRWTDRRKQALLESRTLPTQALVSAINASATPPEVFVQISGVGYYGNGDDPCDETSEPGTGFLADLAVQWEAPLDELERDCRTVIARMGVVLGRTGGALAQMLVPFRLFVGGPIASGRQWFSWIHLHDAAAALAWLIESQEGEGIFNVTAPNPVRNEKFARTVGQVLHRPIVMFTPRILLKFLLGEQATLLCDGQQALPERLEQTGFQFSFSTIESAFNELV